MSQRPASVPATGSGSSSPGGEEEVQVVEAERMSPPPSARGRRTGWIGKARDVWRFFASGRSTLTDKLLVAGALAYILSPIDLAPDLVPLLGWLDDLGMAGLLAVYVASRMAKTAPPDDPAKGGG